MVNEVTRAQVRQRAGHRCEYCTLHAGDSPLARLQIEHIIPRKHGGSDDLDNLALACVDCNLHKGPNLAGIDPDTGRTTGLFHPRNHRWEDHFRWDGLHIVGTTPIGRATVRVLNMNSEDHIDLRSS